MIGSEVCAVGQRCQKNLFRRSRYRTERKPGLKRTRPRAAYGESTLNVHEACRNSCFQHRINTSSHWSLINPRNSRKRLVGRRSLETLQVAHLSLAGETTLYQHEIHGAASMQCMEADVVFIWVSTADEEHCTLHSTRRLIDCSGLRLISPFRGSGSMGSSISPQGLAPRVVIAV